MAEATFNPNELLLERVRYVFEIDPESNEVTSRYTQIEEPSLAVTAEGTQVTDAMGAEIVTFYRAQQGTFSWTNSLHSLDLFASQFGSKKELATDENKIRVPVVETIAIGSDHTVTLKYVPVGDEGQEIPYVKIINDDNTFGKTYKVSAGEASETEFKLEASERKLTFDETAKGTVFVQYYRDAAKAARIVKTTDGVPEVKSLLVYCIFHSACNSNLVYSGMIYIPRAQPNPESVEISLSSDGKHAVEWRLQKTYCGEESKLFEIIVTDDAAELGK